MPTFLDGIAASENIDSSGECVSIAGMDISSLEKDGVLNYEHDQATTADGKPVSIKIPSNVVGKILKAKKIFSEKDCEDERQYYYWKKVQVPYLYVMGELFDDYTDAAKDLAGKLRYDADRKGQNERNVINFSIEGSRLPGAKDGMVVTRSIARKVTITVTPCNKAAIAEIVPNRDMKQPKDDIDSLFKTEVTEIELLKADNKPASIKPDDIKRYADALGLPPMKKNVLPFKRPLTTSPSTPVKSPTKPVAGDKPGLASPTRNAGTVLGTTKSGKSVMSHGMIHEYHGFSSADHREAGNLHYTAAQKATNPAAGKHHMDKMRLHMQAADTAEKREGRFAVGRQQAANRALGKAMTAGSSLSSAPADLTDGAALAQSKKPKKKWLMKAEEAYASWEKREQFVAFMKSRMPHLAQGEIDAIGKTLALKKSLDAEAKLSKLVKKK